MASLLPSNATPLETALSETLDPIVSLGQPILDVRGLKLRNPPESSLPFLHYEYGLGPIARYFADPRACIEAGIPWQRVRGTQDAITKALTWIGYDGEVEAFPVRRKRWNLFMLAMNRVRDAEEPDLDDIEYLAGLSVPLRSKFWRGFRTYDVRAQEYGWNRWSGSMWSIYSGARIRADGVKWSFGRVYERDYTPTQADLEALGVWLADDGAQLGWGAFTWNDVDATWVDTVAANRSALMASGVLAKSAWVAFRDADDAIIGYRRARVHRGVVPNISGVYEVDGSRYAVQASGATVIYVEAMTDFGDGYGDTAASWSLLLGATVADASKPGKLWAAPGGLTGGTEIMTTEADVEFGRTVRERFRAILRF